MNLFKQVEHFGFTILPYPTKHLRFRLRESVLLIFLFSSQVKKDSESPGQFVPWLLDSVSLMLIGAAPFVVILPSGVFMYWITSSTWGLLQGTALRNPAFRRAIRMPNCGEKAHSLIDCLIIELLLNYL